MTFLPELSEPCTFNVLVYADADSEVPLEWGDSDAKEIQGGERVQLRGFSTSSHRVDTLVSYRYVLWVPFFLWAGRASRDGDIGGFNSRWVDEGASGRGSFQKK